jgi:hypothetical protein
VEAHILGYCLRVCLKQKLKVVAESIPPARALESLRSILMVEVGFVLRDDGQLCLPRITEPEKEQALLLHHLAWQLPAQPYHEFTATKSPSHVVQTNPPVEKPCRENQSLVLATSLKLRNSG